MPPLTALTAWIRRNLPHVLAEEQARIWWQLAAQDYRLSDAACLKAMETYQAGGPDRVRAAITAAVQHDARKP
ncbi:hypothetical protein [Geminicoccus harenae]|uniref:hypothetical protein n=1 Tax=Geminicoccus harenae TaxID=2498453 RepID=UPI00168B8C27|nr:hypothetical protein [Geminicoccus harenae]